MVIGDRREAHTRIPEVTPSPKIPVVFAPRLRAFAVNAVAVQSPAGFRRIVKPQIYREGAEAQRKEAVKDAAAHLKLVRMRTRERQHFLLRVFCVSVVNLL